MNDCVRSKGHFRQVELLMRMDIILCSGIAITTVFEKENLTSIMFYLSFAVTLVAFLFMISGRPLPRSETRVLLLLVLIAALGVVSVFTVSISFNYIKKFIIYMTTLVSFYIFSRAVVRRETVRLLLLCNLAVSLCFLLRSRAAGAYDDDRLVLFFSNPNFTGIWLFMSVLLLVYSVFWFSNKLLKALLAADAIALSYMCYQTESRNIWFALVYLAVFVLVSILSKKKRYSKKLLFAVAIFPLVFAFLYLSFDSGSLLGQLADRYLVSDGKDLDSRVGIFKRALEYVRNYPIFGAYRYVDDGSGSFQLHNSHLDVWAAYGSVGLVLFISFLYSVLKHTNSHLQNTVSMIGMAGFMCMLMLGQGEASLYSTGMGMYVFVSSFLLLANHSDFRRKKIGSDGK